VEWSAARSRVIRWLGCSVRLHAHRPATHARAPILPSAALLAASVIISGSILPVVVSLGMFSPIGNNSACEGPLGFRRQPREIRLSVVLRRDCKFAAGSHLSKLGLEFSSQLPLPDASRADRPSDCRVCDGPVLSSRGSVRLRRVDRAEQGPTPGAFVLKFQGRPKEFCPWNPGGAQ